MKAIKLSVIIPAYNEEDTIERALDETGRSLSAKKIPYEIIVVNDGSRDKTKEVCEKILSKYRFRIVNLEKNQGYAAAIKNGIKDVKGEYVCYLDADLQYRPEDMIRMYEYASKNGYSVVIGEPPGKNYSLFKRIRNKTYNYFFIRPFFRIKTKDVDSLKVLKGNVLKNIKLKGGVWIIDLEILFKFKMRGHSIHTFPIKVYKREMGVSKTNTMSIIRTFFEMVMLRMDTLLNREKESK